MAACGGKKKEEQKEDKTLNLHYETTAVYVTDLEKSKKFYKKNFGMCVRLKKKERWTMTHPKTGKKSEVDVNMMILDTPLNQKKPDMNIAGHLLLMCHEDNDKDPDYKLNPSDRKNEERQFGGIGFICDNMKESCAKLEKSGVKFEKKFGDPKGVMGGKGAKCVDPDGTPIVLSPRPKTGVYKREWNLQQTILRTKDTVKMSAFLADLGMCTVMSNGKGEKMGFEFRWVVPKDEGAGWLKNCKTGKLPGGFADFPQDGSKFGSVPYHTNLELISNKDQKIDNRMYDPMIGFLCNDFKMARDFLEKEKKCKVLFSDKNTFVIENPDGGYFTITEFNPPDFGK